MKTRELVRSALLVSAALALSYLERFIPLQLIIPLPGVKLGLANIVTMFALYFLNVKQGFMILIVRCVLGSAFGGGLSGLAMSLTGGILAYGMMAAAKKVPVFSVYGVSILGAAAHNLGQVVAAGVMMGTVFTFYYLPFLLAVAIGVGIITGTLASVTFQALDRLPQPQTFHRAGDLST